MRTGKCKNAGPVVSRQKKTGTRINRMNDHKCNTGKCRTENAEPKNAGQENACPVIQIGCEGPKAQVDCG